MSMYALAVARAGARITTTGTFLNITDACGVASSNLISAVQNGETCTAVITDITTGAVVFEAEADGVSLEAEGVTDAA